MSIGKSQFSTLAKSIKESINGFGKHKHPASFTHRGRHTKRDPIDGYDILRNDRKEKRGGGVCIYIKHNIPYKQFLCENKEKETIRIKIKPKNIGCTEFDDRWGIPPPMRK